MLSVIFKNYKACLLHNKYLHIAAVRGPGKTITAMLHYVRTVEHCKHTTYRGQVDDLSRLAPTFTSYLPGFNVPVRPAVLAVSPTGLLVVRWSKPIISLQTSTEHHARYSYVVELHTNYTTCGSNVKCYTIHAHSFRSTTSRRRRFGYGPSKKKSIIVNTRVSKIYLW